MVFVFGLGHHQFVSQPGDDAQDVVVVPLVGTTRLRLMVEVGPHGSVDPPRKVCFLLGYGETPLPSPTQA